MVIDSLDDIPTVLGSIIRGEHAREDANAHCRCRREL